LRVKSVKSACFEKNHPWIHLSPRPQVSISGCWFSYPSEKYESQLGPLFPIYAKTSSKPPTRYFISNHLFLFNKNRLTPQCQSGVCFSGMLMSKLSSALVVVAESQPSLDTYRHTQSYTLCTPIRGYIGYPYVNAMEIYGNHRSGVSMR
jgi:hypothetical protein